METTKPEGTKPVFEPPEAATLDELITKLMAKRSNGLSGDTKLHYIIMVDPSRELLCMKLTKIMGKQVIATLKNMFKN